MRGTRREPHRRAALRRGFTLVELLAVVAMVGILAALAIVGYRKYLNSAGTAETKAIVQGIRIAEENYKAEMLVYLGCSGCPGSPTGCAQGAGSLGSYYPMVTPNKDKYHWIQPTHGDFQCWRLLNITTDAPTRFGFSVVTGMPPQINPAGLAPFTGLATLNPPIVFPMTSSQPWYVIQARGDRDEDGVPALFLAVSGMGGVYWENDAE